MLDSESKKKRKKELRKRSASRRESDRLLRELRDRLLELSRSAKRWLKLLLLPLRRELLLKLTIK